ncbi:hypothetical protein, partial [Methanosarcina horonobensis]|uniref:hypothetical protein n=1 Tax=Methanosarcina horonobensis TaxID=418008 RepID=UPI000A88280E
TEQIDSFLLIYVPPLKAGLDRFSTEMIGFRTKRATPAITTSVAKVFLWFFSVITVFKKKFYLFF